MNATKPEPKKTDSPPRKRLLRGSAPPTEGKPAGLAPAQEDGGGVAALAARLRSYAIPLSLFLLGLLLYADAMNAKLAYSWDDNRYIEENQLLRDFGPRKAWAIITEVHFAARIPVTILSYAIEFTLWGMRPEGYHVVNIVINAVNGVLVFYFVKHLQGSRAVALITAVLFLVHPVQVESVAWVSERKNLLSLFFFLLAWLAHIRSTKKDAATGWLPLAWVLFLLAVFAKPVAVGAVILFMAYDYFWTPIKPLTILVRNVPYALCGIASAIAIYTAHESGGGIKQHLGATLWENLELAARVHWDYAASLAAPFDLNNMYIYDMDWLGAGDIRVWLGFLLFFGALLFAVWQPLGKPFSLFAVLWVVVMLLPVANIVPIAIQRADRYLYYPSIVIFMLVGILFMRLWERFARPEQRHLLAGALAAIVAVSSVLTVQRTDVWENEGNLWRDHLEDYSASQLSDARADTGWLNAGVYYFREGQYKIAKRYFTDLLEVFPNHFKGNRFMGLILFAEGDYEGAIPYLDRAIRLVQPARHDLSDELVFAYQQVGRAKLSESLAEANQYEGNAYLGLANLMQENYSEAVNYLERAVAIRPNNNEISDELGIAYFQMGLVNFEAGDYTAALEYYHKALPLLESQSVAYNNIGFTYFNMGRLEEAIAAYQTALQLNPQYARAANNLGTAALAAGNFTLSRDAYQKALSLGGTLDASAQSSFCVALAELGEQQDRALDLCQNAIEAEPNNPSFVARLAYAYVKFGQPHEALPIAQQAVEMAPDLALSHRILGDVQAALGDTAAAQAAYEKALELDPENVGAQEGLDNLREQ